MSEQDDLAAAREELSRQTPKRPPTREEIFVKKRMAAEHGKLVAATAFFVLMLIAWLSTR